MTPWVCGSVMMWTAFHLSGVMTGWPYNGSHSECMDECATRDQLCLCTQVCYNPGAEDEYELEGSNE